MTKLFRLASMLAVLGAMSLLAPRAIAHSVPPGQGLSPVVSQRVSHGMRITLKAGNSSYPFGALISTDIVLTNVSKSPVRIQVSACTMSIRTEVLAANGQPYPPPIKFLPICPFPRSVTLKPDASYHTSSIVVLRSGHLRAEATISDRKGDAIVLQGEVLNLKLFSAPREHVILTTDAKGEFVASIRPVLHGHGNLRYQEGESCSMAGGRGTQSGPMPGIWSSADIATFLSGLSQSGTSCVHEEWMLIAGWLGEPAAHLDLNISKS